MEHIPPSDSLTHVLHAVIVFNVSLELDHRSRRQTSGLNGHDVMPFAAGFLEAEGHQETRPVSLLGDLSFSGMVSPWTFTQGTLAEAV